MIRNPKKTKKLMQKLKETGMPEFKGPKLPKDKKEEEEEEEDEEEFKRADRPTMVSGVN